MASLPERAGVYTIAPHARKSAPERPASERYSREMFPKILKTGISYDILHFKLPFTQEVSTLQKKTYIECLRIAACFLVIVNHTNSSIFLHSSPSPLWFSSLTYFFICKVAVPLFLLIMGALLLEKEDTPKKTAERLVRIFTVLVVGSFFYYAYYSVRNDTVFSIGDFLLKLPQTYVTNAYWYLYLYLALLFMLPILQKLVKVLDRQYLGYLLFLSVGVLGTVPLIPFLKLSPHFIAGLIGPPIGLVLLGYYIERYVPMTKRVFRRCLCTFILLIVFQVWRTYLFYLQNPSRYLILDNWRLITIVGSSACFYICVKYSFTRRPVSPGLERGLDRLGRLTFGIYLLSDMVMHLSEFLHEMLLEWMHPLAAVLLWELLIFGVSALITAGLRMIPPLRKWI